MLKDYENVYFDTSSTLFALPVDAALGMMEEMGYHRFFFGTDFPMWDHAQEFSRFEELQLSEQQRRAVLAGNFERLFYI